MASSLAVVEVGGRRRDSGGDGSYSGPISGGRALTPELATVAEDSSESDGETEPAKSFHRRLSTNRDIKCSASLKEGYLLKQTWSFQRWRRRYFKLRGRKLYYAKDTKAVIFDEIELTDLCLAECSTKNINHSFQVITPFRSLVLCAESRREMEDWLGALSAASQRRFHEADQPDCLSGNHHWYATSHARPTYCNVCRDALSGVTSHGLSCEVCKCKVHKRCAAKAINNCKWTTLASVGKEIIEDEEGNISMPHQWMEGNLPVSAKCAICDKNCGSVLRLQDWRCLWCRATVHTQCRPSVRGASCPLGGNRVSIVPPTALHSSQDEAWEAVRPQSSSPLLVFVNSKSGDNQGVKFLRRFKQQLNPAQVFDLISTGPRLGLRLFRPFHPFRILVCSGDGSVGWVMSEIDKLNMQKQCQVGVLPLGTGNDLSRTLGWGSSCDDDTHLPQLLEKYEKACVKILDRWSIMTFERTIAMPKLSLVPGQTEGILHAQITQYEDNLCTYLQNILQSDETSVVLSSAKRLCETVKAFAQQVVDSQLTRVDDQIGKKCDILQQKLDVLLQTLTSDQLTLVESATTTTCTQIEYDEEDMPKLPTVSINTTSTTSTTVKDDTESELSYERKSDKSEKDLSNFNFRKHRRTSRSCDDLELLCWFRFMEREKDALIMRANSLKRAIRNLVEHTESVVEAHSEKASLAPPECTAPGLTVSGGGDDCKMETLKVTNPMESGSSSDVSSCPSPTGSVITARLVSLSPMPDIRRDSASSEDPDVLNLPVPPDFADSRRSSQIQQAAESAAMTDRILQETIKTLSQTAKPPAAHQPQDTNQVMNQHQHNQARDKDNDDEKECSSIMSAISCEEASIVSEADDGRSFCPRKNSDGDDQNGHIGHIDSPETDPSSDAFLPGESLMDDLSSMLGADMYGNDLDSMENTIAEDTTTTDTTTDIPAAMMARRKSSLRGMRNSLKRRMSGARTKNTEPPLCSDDDEFGFENKAFTSQLVYLMDEEPKYCSLAAFVEGNDIARKSFKIKNKAKQEKPVREKGERETKEKEVLEPALDEEDKSIKGSKTSLNKLVKELSNLSEKDEDVSDHLQFPRFSMVVEPPSPDKKLTNSSNNTNTSLHVSSKTCSLTPPAIDVTNSDYAGCSGNGSGSNPSDTSSNSNLLNIDNEHFLTASPAATRRISCCSMLNANEAAILAAAAATSKFYDDHNKKEKDRDQHHADQRTDKKTDQIKKLPIINPLVQLPTWPNVSTGTTGFIGKCLLANADTLCAAVSPLIDPDDAVMEGFLERCVMNNYFGIGIDAKISLDFHHKREEHPEKCRSRAKNYMWYGVLGSKQIIQKTYKNLAQRVQLECDGQRIPLPSLQGIVILNIPSFMGGINFWGSSKEGDFLPPSFDDKILEVVAVFSSMQMAASRLINLQHHRIAQCQSIQINILGDEGVPIQVDGEAWIQPPGIIRILHKNRMQMLCRNRTLENSLRTWEEKQRHHSSISAQGGVKHRGSLVSGNHDKGRTSLTRQSMPGATASASVAHAERSFLGVALDLKVRQHSFSGPVSMQERHHTVTFMDKPLTSNNRGPEILFSEEEQHLLLYFIEVATNLAKWIKILAISHTLDTDLYTLADKTEHCLERIHPKGKMLQGNSLRVEFTKLVNSVKTLYEESCCLLHERQDKLKLREDLENKLSMSLANTEMELRKCVLYDTDEGSLVYLQPLQEDQSEHKRKGLFWLKFRSRSASLSAHTHPNAAQRTAGDWGTQEVATWLDTMQLAEYVDTFVRNDIRGRELLTLARRDLKELGVTKVGHVKRILQAVKDLSQGN